MQKQRRGDYELCQCPNSIVGKIAYAKATGEKGKKYWQPQVARERIMEYDTGAKADAYFAQTM